MANWKKPFLFGIFLAAFLTALAQPAGGAYLRNIPQTLRQPDGRMLECLASGDEYYNWLHDKADYTIIQDPDSGFYVYADKGPDGRLVPTSWIPGEVDPAAVGLAKGLKDPPAVIRQRFESSILRTSEAGPLPAPRSGTLNNIVIFIRFAGESEYTDPLPTFGNMFNIVTAGANSMVNYFREVSYNALSILTSFYPTAGATVISYQDLYTRGYYQPYNAATNWVGYTGGDNGTQRRDREHILLMNAVNAVSSQIPPGLVIDGDNDGYVDNVCFIVSGSPTGWASLLWPHMWALYSQTASINGKRVWTYNFQIRSSTLSSGVGVLCHEMFHSLGSPDLYHYVSNGINPVYSWDVMEYNANPPQHMGAYMKWKYGTWISSIPVITSSGTYALNPLTSSTNNAYRIPSPLSASEYFVVEYRRKTGTFESSIPGSGLLVYRINTGYTGNANGPPDEVYIYRPNGTTTANGSPTSAHFSSETGRTAISDITNPSTFLTAGGPGRLNISAVSSAGSTISFTVGLNPVFPPRVSTAAVGTIQKTTAVSGGTIIDDGGSAVTARGVCWSRTAGPTVANFKTTDGTGTGTYASTLTGLSPGTRYYIRAYASNAQGTLYGEEYSFRTLDQALALPFSESFAGALLPPGWNTFNEGYGVIEGWTVTGTVSAGGQANEMTCTHQPVNPGTSRLILPPLVTTGRTSLNLSFKHRFLDMQSGATFKIQSSTDALNWTDESWSFGSGSGDKGPATVGTTITGNLNSPNTYIAFTVVNDIYRFYYWNIDDVSVTVPGPAPATTFLIPFGSLDNGNVNIGNLGGSAANLTMTVWDANGSMVGSQTASIPAGGVRRTWDLVGNIFNYGKPVTLEISGSQPLTGDNIKWAGPPYETVGAGFTCAPVGQMKGREFYFPFNSSVTAGEWANGYCVISNTSGTTANVTITVYDQNGTLKKTAPFTVPPNGAARSWDYVGSIQDLGDPALSRIVSDQDVVVEAVRWVQNRRGWGFAVFPSAVSSGTGFLVPFGSLDNGNINMGNVSGTTANVTVRVLNASGANVREQGLTIPAKGVKRTWDVIGNIFDYGKPVTVQITSDQALIADNIKWAGPPYDTVGAGFSCGPLTQMKGRSFAFPFNSSVASGEWANGYCVLSNTTGTTANVTITVYDQNGALKKTAPFTIPANGIVRSWDYVGSIQDLADPALLNITSDQDVVVEAVRWVMNTRGWGFAILPIVY